jgi:hypothetical protein
MRQFISRVVVGGSTSRVLGVSNYVSLSPEERLKAFALADHSITGTRAHQVKVNWEWHDAVKIAPGQQKQPTLVLGLSAKRSFSRVWEANETITFWAPQTAWADV